MLWNTIIEFHMTAHALDHSIMQLHMSRTYYAYMSWTTQSCSCTGLEVLMPTCIGPLDHAVAHVSMLVPTCLRTLNHAIAHVSNFLCLHALGHSIMQLHTSPWTTQSCNCTCLRLLMPTCLEPLNAVAMSSACVCVCQERRPSVPAAGHARIFRTFS